MTRRWRKADSNPRSLSIVRGDNGRRIRPQRRPPNPLASMPAEVGRVGGHPGGGLTLQSGFPAGSTFQNMILSK